MKVPPLPTIIIDSNEAQNRRLANGEISPSQAYKFEGFRTQVANLYTGDYSLLGYEGEVSVERKTKSDWYGCLAGPGGDSRRRFRDCLGRLRVLPSRCVIIEAGLDGLAVPPSYSSLTGAQSLGAYVSWQEEFGIPIIPAPSREWAERLTLRWLQSFWRHKTRERLGK